MPTKPDYFGCCWAGFQPDQLSAPPCLSGKGRCGVAQPEAAGQDPWQPPSPSFSCWVTTIWNPLVPFPSGRTTALWKQGLRELCLCNRPLCQQQCLGERERCQNSTVVQQNTHNIYSRLVNHLAKIIAGFPNAKLLVRAALATLFQTENTSKRLLLGTILGKSGKGMSSCHLLKGTFHSTLGQVRWFVSRLQEWALMLKQPLVWNGRGTEELYPPVAPDALASPLLEPKALFNLLCGPKENNSSQLWVSVITLLLSHFPPLSPGQMGL